MFKILKRLIFIILLNMSCVVNNKNYNQGRQILEEEENLTDILINPLIESLEKVEELLMFRSRPEYLLKIVKPLNHIDVVLREAREEIEENFKSIYAELDWVENNAIKHALLLLKEKQLGILTEPLEKAVQKKLSTIDEILSKLSELPEEIKKFEPESINETLSKLPEEIKNIEFISNSFYLEIVEQLAQGYARTIIVLMRFFKKTDQKELKEELLKEIEIMKINIKNMMVEILKPSIRRILLPEIEKLKVKLEEGKYSEYMESLKKEVRKIAVKYGLEYILEYLNE